MLGYFPEPYEDELLYSLLARYHTRSGNTSATATIEDLFGVRRYTAAIDLPGSLNKLTSKFDTKWDITLERIISNHTIYPLFAAFWTPKRSKEVIDMMREKSAREIHLKAGINSNILKSWKFLRFCPACIESDEKRYGESYWRRLHQIPGILICPEHGEVILNSRVPIYGTNPQFYQSVNRKTCTYYDTVNKYSKSVTDKLVAIATETMKLLGSGIPPRDYDWYIENYKCIINQKGFMSHNGYVYQKSLANAFIEYYSPELLNLLGMELDIDNTHNWLSMMTRKSKDYPHPIEHILFIIFLTGSASDFFKETRKPENNIETEKVDRSYPCLNPAASHYHKPVVTDVKISCSRNKKYYVTYSCSCGFVYTRSYSNKSAENIYKYDSIQFYGPLWEDKFKELVVEKCLHLRDVARQMKIDLKTVRKHISRLNLESKWVQNKMLTEPQNGSSQNSNLSKYEELKAEYRAKWIKAVNEHKGIPKSKLRDIDKHLYYWLSRYDKEWLRLNTPVIDKSKCSSSKIDWVKRDLEIRDRVESVVKELLDLDGKPVRITDYRIGKELGLTYLLRNSLERLPLTKQLLEAVCESVDDYRIRRIKTTVGRLKDDRKPIKSWIVKQMTGLYGQEASYIDSVIDSEIAKAT